MGIRIGGGEGIKEGNKRMMREKREFPKEEFSGFR